MPGFLKELERLFGSKNLYTVLAVREKCSQNEVKKAYHKLSLKVHPDRVEECDKEIATQKFQALGKVYFILSDTERRKIYDETGEVDEEDCAPQDRDWYDYWRLLFCKINIEDIKEYEEKYKNSEEELDDLKSAYMESEGNMDQVLENVLCCTVDDEPRFRKILNGLIKKKELPKFPAFVNESASKRKARKRQADKEAEEAESTMRELGMSSNGGEDSLRQLIQHRQQQADSFFEQLEAKYSKASTKEKKKGKGKKGK